MQQRTTPVSIESTQAAEHVEQRAKTLAAPVELTEAELLQVSGGATVAAGPNGNWSTAAGPNGNW